MNAPLLSVRNLEIGFRRDGIVIPAVKTLSFEIQPGETVALVGESGSGKSVSALASLGLLADNAVQSGTFSWKGNPLNPKDEPFMQQLRGNQIGMVFQEPMTSLNPLHTIERQIGESLQLHQRLLPAKVRERTVELLDRVGIPDPGGRLASYPHELSGGQRQRVMIAMALANSPDLLIADEPTTALDVTIEAQILDLLADLKRDSGLSMLFITHDLGVVRQIADRVLVMRRGEVVESGNVRTVFETPRESYTRDLISAQPTGVRSCQDSEGTGKESGMLQATDVKVHFPVRGGLLRRTKSWIKAVDGVDLSVMAGRTVGIVGESGSGKSTLARALAQLVPSRGRITLDNREISQRDTNGLRAFRRQVQIVFQDPFGSLSPRISVGEIIAEGLAAHGIGTVEDRQREVAQVLTEVGLDPSVAGNYPHEFSGGQRQRIAIARALVMKPRIILFDEPTSALDMTVQKSLIALLQDLQDRLGIGYLFISHDIALIGSISHDIMVMKDGVVVERGTAGQIMTDPQHPYTVKLIKAARRKSA